MNDFDPTPPNDDPLKRAFAARSDAAKTVLDLDSGLQAVHRRNSLAHRATRVGASFAAVALVVVGVGWAITGGDTSTDTDGADRDPSVLATDTPTDSSVPPTVTEPPGPSAPDGSTTVPGSGTTVPGTTPDTSPSTTEPNTTAPGTTVTPGPDGTPIDVPIGDWRVVDVAADDVLNVRANAGVAYDIVGTVSPNGIVTTTGSGWRLPNGGDDWYEILHGEDTVGWVNSRFLEPVTDGPAPDSTFTQLPCLIDQPYTGPAGTQSGANADHIASFTGLFATGPECNRVVVNLGTAFTFDALTPNADAVPDGTTVAFDGSVIEVRFPAAITDVDLQNGTQLLDGVAPVYNTRNTDGTFSVFIFAGPATVESVILDQPGRVVVDWRSTGTNPAPFPLATAGMVLTDVSGGAGSAAPTFSAGPITFTGFARPFEANLGFDVVDANGTVQNLQCSAGCWNSPSTGTNFGASATDWTTTWGQFTFTIDGLAPGDYTLRHVSGGSGDIADAYSFTVSP